MVEGINSIAELIDYVEKEARRRIREIMKKCEMSKGRTA